MGEHQEPLTLTVNAIDVQQRERALRILNQLQSGTKVVG
jgi:hypothetical protein